eukprot:m.156190 g.156190  ORF g.156190 m.156190 type:complete len:77 (-) comp10214_c0_seq2:389-619(-)
MRQAAGQHATSVMSGCKSAGAPRPTDHASGLNPSPRVNGGAMVNQHGRCLTLASLNGLVQRCEAHLARNSDISIRC